ncbi:MAG TPA: hypothetical protein VFL83_15180 [Anaeromyxobacter sp.]|nr:hypothetical protein [Anaeromyxobacter sp.]
MSRAPPRPTPSRRVVSLCVIAIAALAAPAASRASSISVHGGAIVLGRTHSATVTVGVLEAPGTEDRPLRLSVNVGAFSEPVRIGPGRYSATYVPPPERYPQVALVAVWKETGADAQIDFLRLALFGTSTVPVKGEPGASVTVVTPFQEFGPVTIDAKGKANVAIEVPPNVRTVEVRARSPKGVTTKRTVAIEVPHYNRLTAALVPYAVTADGKDQVKLHVFYDLDGGARAPDRVGVEATAGKAEFERTQNGRFLYRYVPPLGTPAQDVRFAVGIAGDLVAKASARVVLGLPPPSKVVVKPPLVPLAPASKTPGTVSVLVMSAEGLGLPAQVKVTADAGETGEAIPRGNGLYDVAWTPPADFGTGFVQFRATAVDAKGRSASGAANYQLSAAPVPKTVVATFEPRLVPMDGRSRATVALDVRDAAGVPLEKAALLAVASDGAMGELVSRGGGRYEATYVAPARSPEGDPTLRVADTGGNFEQRFPLPLREDPRRLLLGARLGWSTALDDLASPHAGLDVWSPLQLGSVWLGAGLSVTGARARQTVTDAATGLQSTSEVIYAPVTLRLGWEAYASRRLSVVLGAGATAAFASSRSSLVTNASSATGFGGLGFLSAGWALGPGQLFGEVSYGVARISSPELALNAGGIAVDLGYRVGVF